MIKNTLIVEHINFNNFDIDFNEWCHLLLTPPCMYLPTLAFGICKELPFVKAIDKCFYGTIAGWPPPPLW